MTGPIIDLTADDTGTTSPPSEPQQRTLNNNSTTNTSSRNRKRSRKQMTLSSSGIQQQGKDRKKRRRGSLRKSRKRASVADSNHMAAIHEKRLQNKSVLLETTSSQERKENIAGNDVTERRNPVSSRSDSSVSGERSSTTARTSSENAIDEEIILVGTNAPDDGISGTKRTSSQNDHPPHPHSPNAAVTTSTTTSDTIRSLLRRPPGNLVGNGRRSTSITPQLSARQQLDQYRQKKHRSFRDNKIQSRPTGNLVTLSQLQQMSEQHRADDYHWKARKNDNELGKLVLKHTNKYRVSRGLKELIWDDELASIGHTHSHNMAFKGHPFSHAGFKQRMEESRFGRMGENLAMNNHSAKEQIAKVAVAGWIQSPGHHANLIGNWQYCGIGVATHQNGKCYMTQLFGA